MTVIIKAADVRVLDRGGAIATTRTFTDTGVTVEHLSPQDRMGRD